MNKHDKSHLTFTYAQTQPRTVAGGLRPHLSKTGLRPEPGLKQLEGAEQIDSFGEMDCGFYLERYVRGTYLFVFNDSTFQCQIEFFSANFIENSATQNTRQNAYRHWLYLAFFYFIGTI